MKLFGKVSIYTMTAKRWALRHKRHKVKEFIVRDGVIVLQAHYCENCREMYIDYFN